MKKTIIYLLLTAVSTISAFGQSANRITGKVLNADGKPVAGATVFLEGTTITTLTKADGDFALEAIEAGEYNLIVTSSEYAPQSTAVTVGDAAAPVNITLQTVAATIEVVGRISEYHTEDATVATKIPTRLIDTPQSITSVSPQQIADRQAVDVNDIYKSIAGLNQTTYSAVVFRGFTQREILFNGARGNPYGGLEGDVNNSGFSTSVLRLSNIERVEVLKGPASVLYGSSEPGGVINFITKKPKTIFDGTAEARFGTYGLAAGNADVSVPLGRNFYGRVAGFLERRGSFRNNARFENQNYVANLLWQPGDTTRVLLEYEYIKQDQTGQRLRGIPVDANGNFLTDISFSAAEPSDFINLNANVFAANVSQDFALDGRMDATFRSITNDRYENYHEPRAFAANNTALTREFRDQTRLNDDTSFTFNIYKPFAVEDFGRHTLNGGIEYYRQKHTFIFNRARTGVPSINIFTPVYGNFNLRNYVFARINDDFAEPQRTGFYFQDQVEINRYVQIVGGGRVEHYNDKGRSGTISLAGSDTNFTGRFGAVIKPRDNVAIYGNFANSYTRPSIFAQTPSANGPFAPERGRQFEAGVKFELLDRRLFITSSIYQINKTNVLRADPLFGPTGSNFNALLQIGAVRNRGFDVDLNGAFTRPWNFQFAYSYIDSRILEDNVASVVGQPLPNVPKNTLGFFTRYDLTNEIGVGFGGEFAGKRVEPFAGLRSPGYQTFDANYYHAFFKRLRLNLRLENVFNETYSLSSLFNPRVGNIPGQPRTFTASLTVLSFRKD